MENKDIAGVEGNLEIARVSSYKNGKKKKAGMTTIESMSKLRWNLNISGVIKINQRLKVRTRLGGKILRLHQKMKQ